MLALATLAVTLTANLALGAFIPAPQQTYDDSRYFKKGNAIFSIVAMGGHVIHRAQKFMFAQDVVEATNTPFCVRHVSQVLVDVP